MDGCAGEMIRLIAKCKTLLLTAVQNGLLLMVFFINNADAEDSIDALMQTMKSNVAVKMAYQEIRTLELMDKPWHGSGYMYSMPPDLMIREQLKPKRLLMAVKADKMYYFDPDNHIRHEGEMDDGSPLSLNVAVFKALMNADNELLRDMYLIDFSSQPKRWIMSLKSKQQSDSGFNIVVSGLSDQQVDTIIIKQPDGDQSEFILEQQGTGNEVKTTLLKLEQELTGE